MVVEQIIDGPTARNMDPRRWRISGSSMPAARGFELCRQMRDPETHLIPRAMVGRSRARFGESDRCKGL